MEPNFEVDLFGLLPQYFKDILDYKYLMMCEKPEFDNAWRLIQQAYYNNFIQTADIDTIAEWEDLLGIIIADGDSLDFRRMRVLNRLSYISPLTLPLLKDRLNILIGAGNYEVEIDYANYAISVVFREVDDNIMQETLNFLVYLVPAHLKFSMDLYIESTGTLNFFGAEFTTTEHFIKAPELDFSQDWNISKRGVIYLAGGPIINQVLNTIAPPLDLP